MRAPSPLLEIMLSAAKAAGDGLREDFARLGDYVIDHKTIADPVSIADTRAEETLKRLLLEARPRYGFLGEEGGAVEGADKDHIWIVDPLDGTQNFVRGMPIFAVNVALAREGKVIAGVTHVPLLGETFWAEKGEGAFFNGVPTRVTQTPLLKQAIVAVGIPFTGKPDHTLFAREMEEITENVSGMRRLGAGAVDLAYVAAGRFDAYWEQCVNAWDMAAGVCLVEEAGGVVTDARGRELDLHNGTVLGASPAIHEQLLARLIRAAERDGAKAACP
ncbi:MAG: inositol monophosphatase [Hyphomonadaceae bacterium]